MATLNYWFNNITGFGTELTNELQTAFINLGVTSTTRRSSIVTTIRRLLEYEYGNIELRFKNNENQQFIYYIRDSLSTLNSSPFLKDSSIAFNGTTDNHSKTGTESDVGSFDNDPTTNDEYRSYPFDTTATDVQSKTRSIVNGAESGETSNTKTYNTTDTITRKNEDIENVYEISFSSVKWIRTCIENILRPIRTNMTLCNPLTDDATLLELEY